jgi:transcriptional regulator with PAS, ATPase and Fis domain
MGGTKPIQVEIWVIAATHRDLSQAFTVGRCRKALCFRSDVIHLTLLPLRIGFQDFS